MAEEPSEEFIILSTKVTLLEFLVRALFRDTFLKADIPIDAFDAFASKTTNKFESEVRGDSTAPGSEYAWIMLSEQLNRFLDQTRHEILKARNLRS